MDIIDEIQDKFASISPGKALQMEAYSPDYKTWIIRSSNWYGVGLEYVNYPISLKFANAKLWATTYNINGVSTSLLILSSKDEKFRNEFASICAQFIDPGDNGKKRNELLKEPELWWNQWKELLGNSIKTERAYDVLAELFAFEELLQKNRNPKWSAVLCSTHDIETDNHDYEVKSTIKKYANEITISSQFQLEKSNKKLSILFYKFEPSFTGFSVEDIVGRLKKQHGVNGSEIENHLDKLGFEIGNKARKEKFRLLEKRCIPVDQNFPAITAKSFQGGIFPACLKNFVYTISIDSIDYATDIL